MYYFNRLVTYVTSLLKGVLFSMDEMDESFPLKIDGSY